MKVKVSPNAVRRLPRYVRKLDDLAANGIDRVSSAELGRQMGITPSQIRQDLSTFGEFGLQGYGYKVPALRSEICSILGADFGFTAIMIGVGKIGRALISNFSFDYCGVKLQAAFDVRPELVDSTGNPVPIYPIAELKAFLQQHPVDIAVLCVPKAAAAEILPILNSGGVSAVWNFTNTELNEVEHQMLVENVHFSDSLFSLSYYLAEQKRMDSELQDHQSSD